MGRFLAKSEFSPTISIYKQRVRYPSLLVGCIFSSFLALLFWTRFSTFTDLIEGIPSKSFVSSRISSSPPKHQNYSHERVPITPSQDSRLDEDSQPFDTRQDLFGPVRYPYPSHVPKTTSTGLTLHPNGHVLLHFSSASDRIQTHPFLHFIDQAKKEWEEKTARQSKTLKECVAEYKRRYGRPPPAGFDRWYDYAKEHNVQMMDEYDQIARDLYPFWAIEPTELRERTQAAIATDPLLAVLNFDKGGVETVGNQNLGLIKIAATFSSYMAASKLPPIMIPARPFDEAGVLIGWDQWLELLKRARAGQHLTKGFKPPPQIDLRGWVLSCPPDSALARHYHTTIPTSDLNQKLDQLKQTANRSWIYHHPRSMDICSEPAQLDIHGLTMRGADPIGPLEPLFSVSKTSAHVDILVPPLFGHEDSYPTENIPWSKRAYSKLYWRGSSTGYVYDRSHPNWNSSHRLRAHYFSRREDSNVTVLAGEDRLGYGEVEFSRKDLNERYLNFSLVGQPIQCDAETCQIMRETVNFGPRLGTDEMDKYKYLLDIDGNGWSSRFHSLLWTKHLVIKSTILPEWYTDRIQPWYHYVPSKIDYSDLYDIMSFFEGGLTESDGHDALAEKIAEQGMHWARTQYRRADMGAYMYRLVLEWTRLYYRDTEESKGDFDDSKL